MTYSNLTATTKLSELAGILNGTLTRRVSLDFVRHHGGTATTRGIQGQFFAERFTVGDECHAIWIPDRRLDPAVDATLRLHCSLTGVAGGSDQVAFDVEATYIDTSVDTDDISDVDSTLATGDIPVATLADTYIPDCIVTIPNASLSSLIGLVGFEIRRTAAAGTDYAGEVNLIGLDVEYTINR